MQRVTLWIPLHNGYSFSFPYSSPADLLKTKRYAESFYTLKKTLEAQIFCCEVLDMKVESASTMEAHFHHRINSSHWCSLLILKHRCQPDTLTFTNVNVLLFQTGVKPKTFLRCFWEGECLLINELYECKTWSSSVFKYKTQCCFHVAFSLFEETSCVKVDVKDCSPPILFLSHFISVTWRITKWNWIFSFNSWWIKSRLSNILSHWISLSTDQVANSNTHWL